MKWLCGGESDETGDGDGEEETDREHMELTHGVIREIDNGRLYLIYGLYSLLVVTQFGFHSYAIRLYVTATGSSDGGDGGGGGACSQPLPVWLLVSAIGGLVAAIPILLFLCLLWNTIAQVVTLSRPEVVRETVGSLYCLTSFRACFRVTVYAIILPLTAWNFCWLLTGSVWISRIDLSLPPHDCTPAIFYFSRVYVIGSWIWVLVQTAVHVMSYRSLIGQHLLRANTRRGGRSLARPQPDSSPIYGSYDERAIASGSDRSGADFHLKSLRRSNGDSDDSSDERTGMLSHSL